MEKTYTVAVNGTTYEFNEAELASLDVLDLSYTKKHILWNGKSYLAEITHSDFRKKDYSVEIDGKGHDLKVLSKLDLLIKQMGLTAKVSKAVKDIKAPMPGLILEVNVVPGQQVQEGDYLLVLEAMKMENTITAPRAGVVTSVAIQKGQSVDKNQLLLVIDDLPQNS